MSRTISPERAREIADKYFRDGEPVPDGEATAPPREKRLTAKEAQFVLEYPIDFNATQAAIRAGYSEKTAAVIGYENLRKPHIRAAIEFELKERARRTRWDADQVLQRLGDELNADIGDIFNRDGTLKPMDEWPLVFRQGLVAGIEVQEVRMGDDDVASAVVKKIKLSDRLKRIELIGKHVGVQAFKDKLEHDVPEDSPLAQLARQLEGSALRPKLPDGEAE